MAEGTYGLTAQAALEPGLVTLGEDFSSPKRVILIGHPNVGKSVIFSALTSRYVMVANYPGTTVEIFQGKTVLDGVPVEIFDTPGVNGLSPDSEDERITATVLTEKSPDVIVQVADAKNLRRSLVLTAQLSRLGRPMVLVLNMMDESTERGIQIDSERLSRLLGIPVIETVATAGRGLSRLRGAMLHASPPVPAPAGETRDWVESIVSAVQRQDQASRRASTRATTAFTAAALVGSLVHLENYVADVSGLAGWAKLLEGIAARWGAGDSAWAVVGTLLLGWLAPVLVPVLWGLKVDSGFAHRLGVWARKPIQGLFVLIMAVSLTYQLVGNLGAQVLVDWLENGVFNVWVTPLLQQALPPGFFFDLLVGPYGIVSMGLAYGFAIVLPVVSSFFIAFSFLEDSGYLPRLSILSDRLLRAMGLNGKAFLPMVLGLGCVTMATMTTRVLASRKERFIATLLLALGVPCSAQLGVILGITAGLGAGVLWFVFATVLLQLVLVGSFLDRILPGRRGSFILELPPIRFPAWGNILRKTWVRVVWFVKEAIPLFALGALVLFGMERLGMLQAVIRWSEPLISGVLGLPAQTAQVFLMGFLRRDYGAAGLFDMAREGLLTTPQVVVGLIVVTLFVPCVANFLVMVKEQGVRNTLAMVAFIVAYAFVVGGVAHRFLDTTGLFR